MNVLSAAFTGSIQLCFHFFQDEARIENNNENKGASMKFMALITARFADLPFFTPAAKKREQAPKQSTARIKRSSTLEKEAQTPMGPYRCTSIVFEDSACAAVKAIGRKRFLAVDRDTPTLPLQGCDVSRCNCKYARHNDRRDDDDDRRLAVALQTALYEDSGKDNRRMKKRGRRKSDR